MLLKHRAVAIPGIIFALLLLLSLAANADTLLKPYILVSQQAGADAAAITQDIKQKLTTAGFTIAGEYSPYPDATIIIITNDALKHNAAATEYGGFGAALRVTVTKVNDEVQVAYTNPMYMAAAYRMKSDLSDVAAQMKSTLGDKGSYGPDEGLSADDLRDYHYKWLMPYFTDRINLASYKNYQEAVSKVENTLKQGNKGGVKEVYRIDIPGKEQTVIGVNMTGPDNVDCSGDKYIMSRIDFKKVRSTGHLPYEMLISGGNVYTLPAEFRIAISFPDLSMMGSNSFASIMCAPNSIKKALTYAAGGSANGDSDF
jgi:hypothetical protein